MQNPTINIGYTNGVIAAREKRLLKDKILRFCELSPSEAFRALLESGYGGAETASSVYDYEKLIAREEELLDGFIREYSPTKTISSYLLSPRDFHNAKALIKAASLGEDAQKMLAPEGLISIKLLRECIENNDFAPLETVNQALKEACESAIELLKEEQSGSKVGDIFEKASYSYLQNVTRFSPLLKKLLTAKTDMTNILIAFRAKDGEIAKEKYLPFGKLKEEQLAPLTDDGESEKETAFKAFEKTPYSAFVKSCFLAREKGLPFTEAERIRDGYDETFFAKRKYELQNKEPFLYYVYRRKTENANVRVVFACLLAGVSEAEIKKRLRAF